MGRLKRKKNLTMVTLEKDKNESEIPFEDLSKEFLLMRVKSGTKIRNVLGYAIKEFSNHDCIVWTGVGEAVGKVISCSELFKTIYKGLHQVTRLRYIVLKNSENASKDVKKETYRLPEIHILLSKEAKDITVSGYQAPDDPGHFNFQNETSQTELSFTNTNKNNSNSNNDSNSNSNNNSNNNSSSSSSSNYKGITNIDAEKLAAMELITGRKRVKKCQLTLIPPKKNKKMNKND
ncbi:ribonuclease P protein subunit p25-like protein [Vespula squamosa]|uniref:Ribonuclease P protein subunit p25-like protein n=1 Tax=Vespula squamosa TaxID=30214 RepID=A0ABD1ZUY9_VESSQ